MTPKLVQKTGSTLQINLSPCKYDREWKRQPEKSEQANAKNRTEFRSIAFSPTVEEHSDGFEPYLQYSDALYCHTRPGGGSSSGFQMENANLRDKERAGQGQWVKCTILRPPYNALTPNKHRRTKIYDVSLFFVIFFFFFFFEE